MFGLFKRGKDDPAKLADAGVEEPEDATSEAATATAEISAEIVPASSSFVAPPAWDHGHDHAPAGESGDFKASAGEPLAPDQPVAGEEAVIEALRTVYDPEIPVNIYDLGLIYRTEISATGDVVIDMSLTAPGCPVAGEMPGMVAEAVSKIDGTGRVDVTLVWEPTWTPERMSEDARLALGMDY